MGILGLLSFNILLMLVAFFIYTTATTELYMILSQKLLSDTKAGEIGLRIKPVDENATLNDAAEIMLQEKITVLPVQMKNGKAGLINLNGIRTIERRRWAFAKVNQLAQEASLVIDANEPAAKALPKLAGTGNSVFPLMENSQVVGLIRITDFADALQFKSLQGQDRSKAA
jgi:CBS domain-containing protein